MPRPSPLQPIVPRKLPQQSRSRFTVDAILTAAERAILREGYDRVSTRRIADEAGVGVGSLYDYFPNKEAIAIALWDRMDTAALELYDRALAIHLTAPPLVASRGIITTVARRLGQDARMHRALLEAGALANGAELMRRSVRERGARLHAFLEARGQPLRTTDLGRVSIMANELVWSMAVTATSHGGPEFGAQLVDDAAAAVVGLLFPIQTAEVLAMPPASAAGWQSPAEGAAL